MTTPTIRIRPDTSPATLRRTSTNHPAPPPATPCDFLIFQRIALFQPFSLVYLEPETLRAHVQLEDEKNSRKTFIPQQNDNHHPAHQHQHERNLELCCAKGVKSNRKPTEEKEHRPKHFSHRVVIGRLHSMHACMHFHFHLRIPIPISVSIYRVFL